MKKQGLSLSIAFYHRQESGKHFDPLVVEAFSKCLPGIKDIHQEYADKLDV